MKIKIYLLHQFIYVILLISTSSIARGVCRIKGNRPIISLSGTVTHNFYLFNLFKDPNLKAISQYHGFTKQEFPQTILGGGLFLSSKAIENYINPIVFYDESRELRRNLEQLVKGNKIEIKTRGLDPFTLHENVNKILKNYLEGCHEVMQSWDKKVAKIKQELEKSSLIKHPILFYLGQIKESGKYPDYLMVQDGPVKWLIDQNKIKSYPSDLAYVAWSSKIVEELKKEGSVIEIGLAGEKFRPNINQGHYELKIVPLSRNKYNLFFPSLLIPGTPQILFLEKFVKDGKDFKLKGLNLVENGQPEKVKG